jgi:DNA invertase Pin-like site-specific DNA recombinase
LRRQTEAREAWLRANPTVSLDKTLKLIDASKSGYTRDNFDAYALGRFLENVDGGFVRPGDFLLVENLDRLSREEVEHGLHLLLGLILKGIIVVQLSPVVMEFRRGEELSAKLMMAIMELRRGHSESAIKSARLKAAWEGKRQAARAGKSIKKKVPGWYERENGSAELKLLPDRVKVVRRIFAMALDGNGSAAIAKQLNRDGVPVFGRTRMPKRGQKHLREDEKEFTAVAWSDSVIHHILTSRATLGEYQPGKGSGKRWEAVGDVIPNHFQQIVSPDDFDAVQEAIKTRNKVGHGRRGHHINLFAGLLVDARDGGAISYSHIPNRAAVLVPLATKAGASATVWQSFPAPAFDEAILSSLEEVTVADIQSDNPAAKHVAALAGRQSKLKAIIEDLNRQLASEDTTHETRTQVIRALDGHNMTLRGVTEELAVAQRQAANPIAESWGECRSLLALLRKDNSDATRLKVRAALRANITKVECLFCGPHRRLRLAAVVVTFTSEKNRVFLISCQHHRINGPTSQVVTIPDAHAKWGNSAVTERQLLAAAERAKKSGNTPLGEFMGMNLADTVRPVKLPPPRPR